MSQAWRVVSPIPVRGNGLSGASVARGGTKIIAAYGYDSADTRATRVYDTQTDRWGTGTRAPSPRRSEAAGVSDGTYFYSIGGSHGGKVLRDVERYDPTTDTWASLQDMLTPRAGLAAVYASGEGAIYAIGGRNGAGLCSGSALATVERYDIASGSWTSAAPLPSPRSDVAAALGEFIPVQIFVFGGCRRDEVGGETTFLADVDYFYNGAWSTDPTDLSTPRAGAAASDSTFCGGFGEACYIFVMGGWAGDEALGITAAYYQDSDHWIAAEPMPTPRAGMGVVTLFPFSSIPFRVYTIGGLAQPSTGTASSANEYYGWFQ